jgi:hypothetical protein
LRHPAEDFTLPLRKLSGIGIGPSLNRFPDNKAFAFAIYDDTDLSTVENVGPIYRFLHERGMRTTKSVWPLASVSDGVYCGGSLQDPDYLDFVIDLRNKGFEIALHNVRNHDATRQEIVAGLEQFHRLIGYYPRIHANHSRNKDNIYWGEARLNNFRQMYKVALTCKGGRSFEGHKQSSAYLWGDLCLEKIDYVRNFVFQEINLDRVNPTMPYRDPARPFVKYWFSSCDGADVTRFCEAISEANQELLEAQNGVCIMYTHFACGFVKDGRVDPMASQLLRRLAKRPGWFIPVSTLLDFLRQERGAPAIPPAEFGSMERRWAWEALASSARRVLSVPPTYPTPVR